MLSRGLKRTAPAMGTRSFFGNAGTPAEAVAFAKANGAEVVNLKFTDLLGTLQHITLGPNEIDEGMIENGIGFDGSSIRLWQGIEKSDMLLMPDPTTAHIDPFSSYKSFTMFCDIVDPTENNAPYNKDPRYVLKKTIQHITDSGIADHARCGPEAEFFIFDNVQYSSGDLHQQFYKVDSVEGSWNFGRDEQPNLGYKLGAKCGYFPAQPFDTLNDIRIEMLKLMEDNNFTMEASHHEVGTGGQCELDFQFGELLDTADRVTFYKYVVRNVAARNGYSATFMPKPLYNDNGSGMHQHYSLHSADGTNLFTGDGAAGLSEMALYFIGGIIQHCGSILAFTNPTTNSYKRLVPGYEAPIFAAYSGRNRSAFIRIPISHPKGRRAEFRTPDPTCNPYLGFAAVIQAGLDGIKNKIDPGLPVDVDLYALSKEEAAKIKSTPATLKEAVDELKSDNEYLKAGGVFTDDLIDAWVDQKEEEWSRILQHPTPDEFMQYYHY